MILPHFTIRLRATWIDPCGHVYKHILPDTHLSNKFHISWISSMRILRRRFDLEGVCLPTHAYWANTYTYTYTDKARINYNYDSLS
jgi:hypothetical protein